jgi:hypothetical protein
MNPTLTLPVRTNASLDVNCREARCGTLTGNSTRAKNVGALKIAFALASGAAMLLASTYASADSGNASIEGVWRVTRHGVNCATGQVLASFPAIMAFSKGESYAGYAVPPGSTPAMSSPEYGTWQREHGHQNYSFKILSYGYDNTGAIAGSTEVTGDLVLADRGESFTYDSTVQIFDATGALQATHCGKATGTRFR